VRIVFLGTPQFAVPTLRALSAAADLDVQLVVTQPDRPAGRGRRLGSPPVKVAAEQLGLTVFQPSTLRDADNVARIAEVRPDVLVVVAYGELLRRVVLAMTGLGCVNVHPSLLPRYRGAAPIPAAILAGDEVTGVSFMRLVRQLDAGPILAQREVDIMVRETAESLSARLANVAADMLPEVLRDYASGRIEPKPQDGALATHTREWTPDDARIDWEAPAAHIDRLVRASIPWPVAWTMLNGDRFRILDALLVEQPDPLTPCGTVRMCDQQLVVGTGAGVLALRVVQPAGKRAMDALDWWRGLRVDALTFE
jgi:methionyl-tRNA formyltransferase